MKLCSSLNILWHSLFGGLEWKLTFSSPVAPAEFSKFAGLLSSALSQHNLLGFQIAQLEFHHLPCFVHSDASLGPLCIPGCLALGEWSHHHDYLGHEDLFCILLLVVYSCHLYLISSASVRSLPFLSFIVPIFIWKVLLVSLIFLKRSLVFSIMFFSSISLHWYLRLSYLSLLFFGILYSNGYIFPYLLCLLLLFFHSY